jgi:hypothetical protein
MELIIEVFKVNILPLFDFLYIGIVISGSTLMFNLFPGIGKTKRQKLISVFVFATIISLIHAYWHKDIEGFEYMLVRNFFNYSLAILIYHSAIKTIAKAWEKFLTKYLGD